MDLGFTSSTQLSVFNFYQGARACEELPDPEGWGHERTAEPQELASTLHTAYCFLKKVEGMPDLEGWGHGTLLSQRDLCPRYIQHSMQKNLGWLVRNQPQTPSR